MKKISIITPYYYGKRYLEQLLAMVEKNARNLLREAEVEFLIVNDSPEETILLSSETEIHYSIRIIQNKKNLGIHGARIEGLKQASGDYILMLDQDDKIEPHFLKSQLSSIGGYDFVVANGKIVYGEQQELIYQKEKLQELVKKYWVYYWFGNQILSPGQVLIKRSAVPKVWMQKSMRINCSDDYFLWLLMFESGAEVQINKNVLYTHCGTGSNVSGDRVQMKKSDLEMLSLLEGKMDPKRLFRCRKRVEYELWLLENFGNEELRKSKVYRSCYFSKKLFHKYREFLLRKNKEKKNSRQKKSF